MQILDISLQTDLDVFGPARHHTLSLARAFMRNGDNVYLVTGGSRNSFSRISTPPALVCRVTPLSSQGGPLTSIYRAILNNVNACRRITSDGTAWDVVYERHSLWSFAGAYISKKNHIPLVFEVNGIPDEEIILVKQWEHPHLRWALCFLTKAHLRLAQVIVVQTAELRNVLLERYGCKNVVVVPNGADSASRLNPVSEQPLHDAVLCFIGTVDEQHDLGQVLDAMRTTDLTFTLNIVGDGGALPAYRSACEGDARFVFKGRLSHADALRELGRTDICLAIYGTRFPLYRKYGFYMSPMKVFECLAHGVPTIYFGLESELISALKKREAIVVASSAGQLISEVSRLMSDGAERGALARNAAGVAVDFTWEKAAKKTMDAVRPLAGVEERSNA